MRRKAFVPIVLGLVGLVFVAIVRAQDGDGRPTAATHKVNPTRQGSSLQRRLQAIRRSQARPQTPRSIQRSGRQEKSFSGSQSAIMLKSNLRPEVSTGEASLLPVPSRSRFTNNKTDNKTDSDVPAKSTRSNPAKSTKFGVGSASSFLPSVLTKRSARPPAAPAAISSPEKLSKSPASSRLVARRTAKPEAGLKPAHKYGVLTSSTGPTLRVETSGPETIVLGKPASYVVTLVNLDDIEAEDIVINVHFPPWAEVVSSDASSGTARFEAVHNQDGQLRWMLSHLDANSRQQLTLSIVSRQSRPFDLAVDWTFRPNSPQYRIKVLEPKLHLQLSGPESVKFGKPNMYTIVVSNPGTGDVENVVLQLDSGALAGADVRDRKVGNIAAGDHRKIEIELTPQRAGSWEISAHAIADGDMRAEAIKKVQVRRANLQIVVGGPKVKYAGTVANYQVRVTNTGDAPATDLVTQAVLPQGAKYVSSTKEGVYRQQHNQVQWKIESLDPGAVHVLELECVLSEAGGNRLEIHGEALGDLTASGTFVTQVEALADLKLVINDPRGPVPVGKEAIYEIHIINRGTKAAEQIHVVAFFSEGIEPISVEGGRAEVQPGQVVMHPIPYLGAGEELVFKITARADEPKDHVFRAEVVSSEPQTRLVAEETTRYYDDPSPASSFSSTAGREIIPRQASQPKSNPLLPLTKRR